MGTDRYRSPGPENFTNPGPLPQLNHMKIAN
jgi:hypothetical protein